MEILIVLLCITLVISAISTAVIKIMSSIRKTDYSRLTLLYRLDLILFLLSVLTVSFYPGEAFITGFESAAFILVLGTYLAVIWKVIFKEKNLLHWIIGWAAASAAYYVAQSIVYSDGGFLKNLVDFCVIEIILLAVLAFVAIGAKSIYTRLILKVLAGVYITYAVFFSIMPPNDFLTVIISIIGVMLIGIVPAIILYFFYKKTFSSIREASELMDKI